MLNISHLSDKYVIKLLTVNILPTVDKIPVFKSGAWQSFGIEYANDDW